MVSDIKYAIKKAIYKTCYLFMILRILVVAFLGAWILNARNNDYLVVIMVIITLALYLVIEIELIFEWENKNRYWFKTIEDMQFYFESIDNRLQWFMKMLSDNYSSMYMDIVRQGTYVEGLCSYEFCKYLLSRVENLSDYNSHHYQCFIAKCTKDCSRGTQPNDPKAEIITHVLMAFHGDDTQLTTPVIIDPFYSQYMPQITDKSDVACIRVVTDPEEAEEVYRIIELYSVDRCHYIKVGGHVREISTCNNDSIPFKDLRKYIRSQL